MSPVIGWDARKLFDGGIGTYVRCLLGALARDPRGLGYVAALDPGDVGRVRWPGEVREVRAAAGKYGLAEHWVVPRALDGATLLHAPHYTLPMFWRGPAVVTIHDLIHLRFPRFYKPGASLYARAMAGAAAAKARVVIADSEFTRRDVIERLAVPESKVRVVPLAVPEGLSRPAPEAIAAFVRERRLPQGYVLYVGARKAHKNLALLLHALAAMPAGARPPLVLSGGPWDAGDSLARLVSELGLAPHVHFAGASFDDAAMACLYAGAELYAHPALCEGFGLPPLEAMACGTPVLSSDAGSLAEVLGEAAELLPPEHPAAWADALARLLGDSSRRVDLVRRGHAQVARYSWTRAADGTRAIYREALA